LEPRYENLIVGANRLSQDHGQNMSERILFCFELCHKKRPYTKPAVSIEAS